MTLIFTLLLKVIAIWVIIGSEAFELQFYNKRYKIGFLISGS